MPPVLPGRINAESDSGCLTHKSSTRIPLPQSKVLHVYHPRGQVDRYPRLEGQSSSPIPVTPVHLQVAEKRDAIYDT